MKLYSNVTYIFIIWLVSVLLISFFSFSKFPHSGMFNGNFWESFANWDGGHYLGIAQSGYSQKFQYAFFPLYPLAIRFINIFTQNPLLSAILISTTAAFLGIQLLYKLVALDFDKKIAEKVILALLFFPTSFFFLTAYSEGLFFLLTIAAFYFLRQNKLFWATVAVAFASGTRLVGLAVVAGFLIEIGISKGFNRKNWFVLFAPLGFIIYCIFLYKQTGDPFYFITAESHWQRTLTPPGVGFWEVIKNDLNKGWLDLIFAIFGLGFAIRSFRFLSPALAVYSLFSVSIPLFSPTLLSMPRFLLPIFPIFILMSIIKNRYLFLFYQILSIGLLAIFTALFITGYWIS